MIFIKEDYIFLFNEVQRHSNAKIKKADFKETVSPYKLTWLL